MPSDQIQWFPGHMAKTRRIIGECLPSVDVVIEVLDARIPYSSRNPDIPSLIKGKPLLTVLNKASLADRALTSEWKRRYTSDGQRAIVTDCVSGYGMNLIGDEVRALLSAKVETYERKGMSGRSLKAMVVGIPNVGKSSFINKLAGAKKAKVEDRPGVTLTKQWITTKFGLDLLDMPGVLWPKFEEKRVGENLALTGAIRDAILDSETLAVILCARLRKLCPDLLCARYKLDSVPPKEELSDLMLFEAIGRKRGFLVSGGEINYERTAAVLLDEFRGGKIGAITLERP